MKNFNTNTENKEEWLTPPEITTALRYFDLDPCSPIDRPWNTAFSYFTKEHNGLEKPWKGRVWCNPPYGKETFKWLEKLHKHGNGIALIFARTETKGFHSEVWNKADAIFFFKGRLRFCHVDGSQGGTANAPSCLVAYGRSNALSMDPVNSGLKGKLIIL